MSLLAVREALADPDVRVLVVTGAGISVAAGLPTYRGPGGIYPAGVIPLHASDASSRNLPALWERLLPLAAGARAATPTRAHTALARLVNTTIITQNIDGLHEAAGSANVLAMHGTLAQVRCSKPGANHRADLPSDKEFRDAADVPRCAYDNSRLRPDVVLFGERLGAETLQAAREAADASDVVLAIGTSLQVHPVASFVSQALDSGAIGAWLDVDPARALSEVYPGDRASFTRLVPVLGDVQKTLGGVLGPLSPEEH